MSYSEVFGGGSINPSQRTYLSLVTAVDVQLLWPNQQQIGGDNVAADIIDVDATVAGLNVDFDDARIVSRGFTSLITNVGANTVTIRDNAGGTIISLLPGTSWFIYLTDNSTAAGTWRVFQLGASVSVADAAALAGAGLKAIGVTLNQRVAPTLTAVTPVNWVDADRAQFTIWTGGVGVLNLPVAATVGSDWFSYVRNAGTGTLTLTPPGAEQVDSQATLILNPGDSCIVITDGTDFYTVGLGGSATIAFDFVQIDVSGSGDFILSGVQLNRISYQFIGALTGNRRVVVPNSIQQYWVDNSTTGAFTFEVGTAAQVTNIQVVQNNRSILYCDGTEVVDAETGTLTPPITIGQGGTGAVNAAAALANLGGVPTARLINSGDMISGGGDLTADRTLAFDLSAGTIAVPATGDFLVFQDIDNANVNRRATIADVLALANITDVEASAAASRVLRGDGAGGWDDAGANILIDSIGRLECNQVTFFDATAQFRASAADFIGLSAFGVQGTLSRAGAITDFSIAGFTVTEIDGGVLRMFEQAAAAADQAGYAQIWVRNDAPNTLMYTRDDGTDVPIVEVGSFSITFDLGFSDSNLVTLQYIRIGDLVHVTMPTANFGNSNGTNLATGNDWPVALRPDSTRYGSTICTNNSADQILASFFLTSAGAIEMFCPTAAGRDWGNNWTAAGVKGVNAGWSWSYRISDS
jgi:hypothetical protein